MPTGLAKGKIGVFHVQIVCPLKLQIMDSARLQNVLKSFFNIMWCGPTAHSHYMVVHVTNKALNPDSFLENLETRSKSFSSPGPANGQSPSSGSQSPVVPQSGASTGSSSPSTPQPPTPFQTQASAPQPPPAPPPSAAPAHPQLAAGASPSAEPWGLAAQSPEHPRLAQSPASAAPRPSTPASPALAGSQEQPPQKRGFISRWFGSSAPTETPSATPGENPHPCWEEKDPGLVILWGFVSSYFVLSCLVLFCRL